MMKISILDNTMLAGWYLVFPQKAFLLGVSVCVKGGISLALRVEVVMKGNSPIQPILQA